MMSISPKSASIDDVEKNAMQSTRTAAKVVTDGQVDPHSAEYGRYLELHHKLEGPGRAKLVRKCESQLTQPASITLLTAI